MTALRVLHIDDDPDVREAVLISLGHPEFSNWGCETGEEALTIAKAWQPDIILLDVVMPGMDGMTVLKELRGDEQTGWIPVVFLTVCSWHSDIEHFLSLGALGVIPKPIDPMAFAGSVRGLARPRCELQRSDRLRGGVARHRR